MERPPLQLQGPLRSPRGGPTERSSLKSPHTTPCEGHKLLLTKRSGGWCIVTPGVSPGAQVGVGVLPAGAWPHGWHRQEQGLGSEEAKLLFLLLLLPLGHAVEFLLGFPKDVSEVSV